MQPTVAKSSRTMSSSSRKTNGSRYVLGDQEQGNFSVELWKRAFKDACERLCPIRAGGHECGCLPVLARLVCDDELEFFSSMCSQPYHMGYVYLLGGPIS